VKISKFFGLVLCLCLFVVAQASALTFEYTDGTKVSGDIVRATARFLQVRTDDNRYIEIEWGKLSQNTLQELKTFAQEKRDNRLLENVEPYIEIPEEEIIKKTEVVIKPVPRLERPQQGSLLGAMFGSSVGLFCLLVLYAANIYAGYEISVIRAYPAALVCGISAVAPIIGPIVFLCLPTKLQSAQTEEELAAGETGESAHAASYTVPGVESPAAAEAAAASAAASGATTHAAANVPQTQVFKRGQFTFNRRFIETKFASFFGAVRRGADKDMVLLVKSTRGEFVASRITRVAANDMHIEVQKGGAPQEIQMPFAEIQELHLKHKDA